MTDKDKTMINKLQKKMDLTIRKYNQLVLTLPKEKQASARRLAMDLAINAQLLWGYGVEIRFK